MIYTSTGEKYYLKSDIGLPENKFGVINTCL